MNGGAEEEPLRALSDIRQRFPQWRIGQSGDGWQATPRDEPGRGQASLPGIPPRPRQAPHDSPAGVPRTGRTARPVTPAGLARSWPGSVSLP